MRQRTAFILLAIGLFAMVVGIYVQPRPEALPAEAGQRLFPTLAGALATATSVEITSGGKRTTLVRDGAVWGIEERAKYPADPTRLRALFAGLIDLRFAEPRTADPASWARLGVDDPAAPGSTATSLVVKSGDATLASVILGHRSVRSANGGAGAVPESIYIRHAEDNRSWRAEGHIVAEADPQIWLSHPILDIKQDRIAHVDIHRDDATLSLSRQGDTLVLDNPSPLDQGGKLDDIKPLEVAQALENLVPMDVEHLAISGERVGSAVFTTTDGQILAVDVFKDGEDVWVGLHVTGQGAESLAWASDWSFKLPSWRLGTLVPQAHDFIKGDSIKPDAPK